MRLEPTGGGEQQRQPRVRPLLWLLAILLIFVAVNLRWIWIYRHNGVHDIDEAGYLAYSVIDYFGFDFGGLRGWISAIEAPSIQAPLTMALTSLVYMVTGLHMIMGLVVTIAAATGCIAAAYYLGRSLSSSRVGLIAAILTASCPVIINYARSYQFSTLTTFVTTLALVAMLRSARFRHVGWSAAFGVLLGLMPLSRTMSIAFVPGVALAAVVLVLADREDRLRRFVTLVAALVLAVIVAATWLVPNGWLVAQYLLHFGYGAQALEYGPRVSKLGLDAWISMAQAFNHDIYTPHLILFVLGVFILVLIALRYVAKRGLMTALRYGLGLPVLAIVIVAAEIVVVLTTTSNKGSGFFAPVVPAMAVLTAYSFDRLSSARWWHWMTSAAIAIVVLMAVLPLVDLRTPFAPEWVADLPVLGNVTITDGRGMIHRYERNAGYGSANLVEPVDKATSQAWNELSEKTAAILVHTVGKQATIAYGFRNVLYNVNTINLESLLQSHSAFGAVMIDPLITGESVAGYLNWLRQDASRACALLTSNKVSGDFQPVVNPQMMETAVTEANFAPVRTWGTPDGQVITLWEPKVKPSNCL